MFNPEVPFDLKYLPRKINFNPADYLELLGETRAMLGELKGSCRSIPDPMILIYPTLIKEAVDSSKIENIETTVETVLQNQLLPDQERNDADKLVLQYRDSVLWGFNTLNKVQLSTQLIIGLQKRLLASGNGIYRRLQNHIENKDTRKVIYTPPIASKVPELIGNWENFVNNDSLKLDPLIKCAIAHYQFEAIHPFEDGNGRTGRILILLQLIHDSILAQPVLHVSGYINKHRPEYYKALHKINSDDNWTDYILFMLNAFLTQAKSTNNLVLDIKRVHHEFKVSCRSNEKIGSIHNLDLIADTLFAYPTITASFLSQQASIHFDTASSNLKRLSEAGYLQELKVGRYNFYKNQSLMKLLKKN